MSVTRRFTRETDNAETLIIPVIAKNQYRQSPGPGAPNEESMADVASAVSNIMGPR